MLYNSVSEVVAKLNDKGFCAPHIAQVNKGSKTNPRWLDVVEWHEAVRMLDEVFGPFGWDAEIVGSHTDYERGVYTVDLTLTGRAVDDETGEVLTLKRPGRGLGLVPRSAIESDSEHDRQAHGAKSDAITNASKALGDGFGLFLYQKDRPQSAAPSNGNGAAHSSGGDKGARPSEKQMKVLLDRGYTQEQVDGMDFKTWKGVIDDIFGKRTPSVAPAGEPAERKAPAKKAPAVVPEEHEADEIPW